VFATVFLAKISTEITKWATPHLECSQQQTYPPKQSGQHHLVHTC